MLLDSSPSPKTLAASMVLRQAALTTLVLGCAVLIGPAAAQTCEPVPQNLISWWPDDGNANDIKGGNHGTPQNGAMFAPGKVGQAFSLDGVDDFVEVVENGSLDLNGDFTIDLWVSASQVPIGILPFVSKYDFSGSNFQDTAYAFSMFETGKLQFEIACGSNTFYKQTTSAVVQPNVFTHLAAVYHANPNPSLDIYVNGIPQAGNTFGSACNFINQNDIPFRIGLSVHRGNARTFFQGLIDEVEIFDRALSASEIQAIYNAGSAGKCKAQEVKIVFTSNRDGNFEIYSMSTDGSGLARLTTNPALEAFPAWSPDATKIAFTSSRGGNFDVYVMNADGAEQTRLTTNARVDGGPACRQMGRKSPSPASGTATLKSTP